MDHADGDLVSTGYVARLTGLPLSTLKHWDRSGKVIPSLRLAGSNRRAWRVSDLPQLQEQVSEMLAAGRQRGGPERTA